MIRDDDPLGQLYPHLQGGQREPGSLDEPLLESIRQKAAHSIAVKRRFFEDNAAALLETAQTVAAVYRRGGRMLAMGNGGSACDAAHFSVEFLHPVTAGRPALAAINLASDNAMMSAVANDVGYEHVFTRQVGALGQAGDGLVGFSTSGNSDNLLRAFTSAKRMGLSTVALAGGDGGAMAACADIDHCLVVATDSVHRVQEVHVAAYHILWDLVHTLLADSRGGLAAAS